MAPSKSSVLHGGSEGLAGKAVIQPCRQGLDGDYRISPCKSGLDGDSRCSFDHVNEFTWWKHDLPM